MLQIKKTKQRDLDKICQDHYSSIQAYILRKVRALGSRQRDFIKNNLERIITSKPNKLSKVQNDYVAACTKPGRGRQSDPHYKLSEIINYDWFSKKETTPYNAYTLAERLRVNTCPYCNRNYTVTVSDGPEKIVRPDFDHFLPKSEYPLLALSFYNLIPSCMICNRSVKNQAKVKYGKYIHPYEAGFDLAARFEYKPTDVDSGLGINTKLKITLVAHTADPIHRLKAKKAAENAKLFKIDNIYQMSHCGEVADIIRKYHISGGKYLENLHRSFPSLGTIDDLYRIAFGAYHNPEDFEKRPLSKLTKDIVDQLSFVLPGTP